MSGTWAVVTDHEGREDLDAGFSQAEAEARAADIRESLGVSAAVRDLLPGLEARFPAGTPVWLNVHWRRGQRGQVLPGPPDTFARWPLAGPTPWFLASGGAYVHVRLDDGCASWWAVRQLETRE